MNDVPIHVLKHAGTALTILGIAAIAVIALWSPKTIVRRKWAQYEQYLSVRFREVFVHNTTGPVVARTQLAVLILGTLGLFVRAILQTHHHFFFVVQQSDTWTYPLLFAAVAAVGPYAWIQNEKKKRRDKLEDQVDGWLQILSNALTATPSLGDAIESSRSIVQEPLSQELDLLSKEFSLGTPMEDAINNMSRRIGSQIFSAASVAILVGRRTGGDLSKILAESASALREMKRLEGVLRAKTSQAKVQILAIALMPIVMGVLLSMASEGHLDPLFNTTIGSIALGVGTASWILGVVWARAILMVRI